MPHTETCGEATLLTVCVQAAMVLQQALNFTGCIIQTIVQSVSLQTRKAAVQTERTFAKTRKSKERKKDANDMNV